MKPLHWPKITGETEWRRVQGLERIHSTLDECLGCFHFDHLQMMLCKHPCSCALVHTYTSETAWSFSIAFSSLLNLTTLFLQSGCISLHSHQQCELTWLDSSHPLWEWGDTSLRKKEEARQGKDLGVNPRSSDFNDFPVKPLLILEQGIKHKNEALGRWVFKVLSWFVLQERVVMVVGFT